MGVIATFDYTAWIGLFPQFSNVPQNTVTGLILPVAVQYIRNDGGGPVNDMTLQTQLINLMVAHVAQLLFGSTTQPLSPLVGRISSAAEGSVNVATDFPATPSNAWFIQTQYGAMFWQMSLPFRLGRYFPKITPLPRGVYPGALGYNGAPFGVVP